MEQRNFMPKKKRFTNNYKKVNYSLDLESLEKLDELTFTFEDSISGTLRRIIKEAYLKHKGRVNGK